MVDSHISLTYMWARIISAVRRYGDRIEEPSRPFSTFSLSKLYKVQPTFYGSQLSPRVSTPLQSNSTAAHQDLLLYFYWLFLFMCYTQVIQKLNFPLKNSFEEWTQRSLQDYTGIFYFILPHKRLWNRGYIASFPGPAQLSVTCSTEKR